MRTTIALLLVSLTACGGAKATSPAPAAPSAPQAASASDASKGTPLDKHAAAEAAAYDDASESGAPIVLEALVPKTAPKSAFPKAKVGDHECLDQLPFTGHHDADFKTLVDRCGAPTGLVEYVKPSHGRLHHKRDKRDEFRLKVNKGFCYRYFAVADDGIKDIDIVILKDGALLGMDRSEQPIAVVDPDKLWCVDEDMDLAFSIEVDGGGAGGYTFGVWTRPDAKKKK